MPSTERGGEPRANPDGVSRGRRVPRSTRAGGWLRSHPSRSRRRMLRCLGMVWGRAPDADPASPAPVRGVRGPVPVFGEPRPGPPRRRDRPAGSGRRRRCGRDGRAGARPPRHPQRRDRRDGHRGRLLRVRAVAGFLTGRGISGAAQLGGVGRHRGRDLHPGGARDVQGAAGHVRAERLRHRARGRRGSDDPAVRDLARRSGTHLKCADCPYCGTDVASQRDIYFLVFDRYGSADAIERRFDITDNDLYGYIFFFFFGPLSGLMSKRRSMASTEPPRSSPGSRCPFAGDVGPGTVRRT